MPIADCFAKQNRVVRKMRLARTVCARVPHHITKRGNRHEDVFFTGEDRETYLAWLNLETAVDRYKA